MREDIYTYVYVYIWRCTYIILKKNLTHTLYATTIEIRKDCNMVVMDHSTFHDNIIGKIFIVTYGDIKIPQGLGFRPLLNSN